MNTRLIATAVAALTLLATAGSAVMADSHMHHKMMHRRHMMHHKMHSHMMHHKMAMHHHHHHMHKM